MSTRLKLFATCPKGVGDILAAELLSLGAEDVKESAAGASFAGTMETAYRTCLWSRVASRVLYPLADFVIHTEEELYAGIRDFPWEDHFSPDSTFAVSASGKTGLMDHTHFASLKVKDAVVDRFRDLVGRRPSVDVRNPDIRLNLHMAKGLGTISLDLSGEALHRRGYRRERGKAPLKENLASAILIRAGWPGMAMEGLPFIDPMCGSGTLPIEAALMAGDVAPGIFRASFGFMGWTNHQTGIWTHLQIEARYRMEEGLRDLPPVQGYDADRGAVRAALDNLQRAGLERKVHVQRTDLEELALTKTLRGRPGLVLVNPPYGERLGEKETIRQLYSSLGQRLRSEFMGWRAAVFTGNPELGRELGLRAFKVNNLYNGNIPCRLLHFDIREESFTGGTSQSPAAKSRVASEGSDVQMFANRLRKNLRVLGRWAERENISCFRLYDADVPEFNLAVDLYDGWAHVQEYRAPHGVDPARAAARLESALGKLGEILNLPRERVVLKVRERQRGGSQYHKKGEEGRFFEVREGGLEFWVNLTDYLDTGLFLDHRLTRRMIREMAPGKRFLNLFCYTASATVYAAEGGAASSTSVDMSNTYLDWARRNMDLNSLGDRKHSFVRADVVQWIAQEKKPYDLIFLDPPTYSRSKGMAGDFDVQRDHGSLIGHAVGLLSSGGTLIFSTNRRGFVLDTGSLEGLKIEDITEATIPRDFEKSRWVHKCYEIRIRNPEY